MTSNFIFQSSARDRARPQSAPSSEDFLSQVQSLQHYQDEYTYIASGDFVVVEGWESGVAKGGAAWPVKGRSDGRFCNVFRFRGELISHLHVYVDPDFAGRDTDRFYWGLEPAAS